MFSLMINHGINKDMMSSINNGIIFVGMLVSVLSCTGAHEKPALALRIHMFLVKAAKLLSK